MKTFEEDYLELLHTTLNRGAVTPSRAGPTKSLFGTMLKISDMRYGGFPVITTRQMFVRPIMGELFCFLNAKTGLQDFIDAGCNYWTPNAKAWKENEGVDESEMTVGVIYGVQWRIWESQYTIGGLDQLSLLIEGIRNDPYGRRHIVTAWNPAELNDMCLPPCHILFQCKVVDKHLSMIVYMRSVDLCVGLPTDIILYAALLQLICNETNYKPGDLIFMLGDTHIYENHIEALHVQLRRKPHELPQYDLQSNITTFKTKDLVLNHYQFDPRINYDFNL